MAQLADIIARIKTVAEGSSCGFVKVYEKDISHLKAKDTLVPALFIKNVVKRNREQIREYLLKEASIEMLIMIKDCSQPFSELDDIESILEEAILTDKELVEKLCVRNGIEIIESNLTNDVKQLREKGGAASVLKIKFTYHKKRGI